MARESSPAAENHEPVTPSVGAPKVKASNLSFWFTLALWVVCLDWVFQWHHWFVPGFGYPGSALSRFGILAVVVLLGLIPASLLRKADTYRTFVSSIVFAPLSALVIVLLNILTVHPVVYKYPRRVLGAISVVPRWFCSTLVGKTISLMGVVALTWMLPHTESAVWIRLELASLAVAMAMFMGGMLNLASSPLSYLSSLHRSIFRVGKAAFVLLARHNSGGLPQDIRVVLLVQATGFAHAMMDELRSAQRSWRHFAAFIGGLGIAFLASVFAFASVYVALNKLVPTGLELFNSGYSSCVSLSFSVITTLAVPEGLLYPLSIHSAAVFAEVTTCFYLAAITVWIFTAGAERNTETMVEELAKMWRDAAEANIAELKVLDPTEKWQPQIQQVKVSWLKRLR
jgi:hypothetical protein